MASLPPYETLVRWTVADTTRWLGENGLIEFKDSFKKNGVDGSKLAKLTDTDIDAFNVKSAKKRIQLKNAVSNIDKSKVNSLPKTQGMMNAFRRNDFSEPAPPPRPPRKALPPEPEPEPPFSHAPPPPSNHHHHQQHHHEDDDDNEDAYSWGDDFYQSDPEDPEDYENQQEWTQDHNSNYIGNDSQETYEDMNRTHGNDEEVYEEPTSSPNQSFNGGGILQKLQRELTLRKTAHTKTHRTHRNNAESNDDDDDDEDEDSENYELPIGAPPQDPVPSVPPRPGGRKPKPPPERVEEKAPARPPPRPPKLTPHPAKLPPTPQDEEELVYDEPEEEKPSRPREQRPRAGSRQLPPVPILSSPAREERNLPPPPKSKNASRQPIPPPVQPPPPQEQEVYEEVDQGPVQTSNRDTRPPAKKPQPVKRTSSRPLPGIPPTNGVKETNNTIEKVVKVPQPPRDELDIYDWYHKNIDRTTAEDTLKQYSKDGMYLIRKSRRGGTEQQYTLTIYKQVRVYNLPIRKREKDGKFALGAAKPNELEFDSVPHLVDYFKTKLIMLNPNAKSVVGSTKLIEPMPK